MAQKISSHPLEQQPFPHFVVDDLLPVDLLDQIDAAWPAPGQFSESGIPGNAMFMLPTQWDQLPDDARTFWSSFTHQALLPLYRETFERFAHFYSAKFGDLLTSVNFAVRLMEAHPDFADREIHTHHWHDPTWLFTSLIYIDAGDGYVPGTTLYGTPGLTPDKDPGSMAQIAAQTLQWDDMENLKPVVTADFKSDRMLSFLDCPISYHGVLPPAAPGEPQPVRRRRVVRCHATAPRDLVQDLFGLPHVQYEVHRRRASRDPMVVGWLEDEIRALGKAASDENPGASAAYAERMSFHVDIPAPEQAN